MACGLIFNECIFLNNTSENLLYYQEWSADIKIKTMKNQFLNRDYTASL